MPSRKNKLIHRKKDTNDFTYVDKLILLKFSQGVLFSLTGSPKKQTSK
jgi:hypothetical protein